MNAHKIKRLREVVSYLKLKNYLIMADSVSEAVGELERLGKIEVAAATCVKSLSSDWISDMDDAIRDLAEALEHNQRPIGGPPA